MPVQRRRWLRIRRPTGAAYPPPAIPAHPQLAARRRRRSPIIVAIVVVALVVVVGIVLTTSSGSKPGQSLHFANQPYTPQVERNFESVGYSQGPLSQQAVDLIAKDNAYEFLPKFADAFNIQQHFAEVRRLVAAGKQYGNDIKVIDYFNSSYWYDTNVEGWKPYSNGFQQSWLLRDATGKPIPYFGNSAGGSGAPVRVGWMLDLSNPAFRAWAVSTIVDWMKSAPYGGIDFDAANQMSGAVKSRYVANGQTSFNQLLCGAVAATDLVDGNCSRVQEWNAGLAAMLGQTTKVLNGMDLQVRYNGIAPTTNRGATRNTGLLRYTNMVDNEGFCLSVSPNNPTHIFFNSLVDDAKLMQSFAKQGKAVTQTTSTYSTSPREKYGDYCAAGFLIGWQPGYSYLCIHPGYAIPPTADHSYPLVPEQDLNLGKPLTFGYTTAGDVLSRQFQNGFVAVNSGTSSASVTVPEAIVSFANGSAGPHYIAGQAVELAPHSAILGLTRTYLGPAAK